jgi:hypothetical protein
MELTVNKIKALISEEATISYDNYKHSNAVYVGSKLKLLNLGGL